MCLIRSHAPDPFSPVRVPFQVAQSVSTGGDLDLPTTTTAPSVPAAAMPPPGHAPNRLLAAAAPGPVLTDPQVIAIGAAPQVRVCTSGIDMFIS